MTWPAVGESRPTHLHGIDPLQITSRFHEAPVHTELYTLPRNNVGGRGNRAERTGAAPRPVNESGGAGRCARPHREPWPRRARPSVAGHLSPFRFRSHVREGGVPEESAAIRCAPRERSGASLGLRRVLRASDPTRRSASRRDERGGRPRAVAAPGRREPRGVASAAVRPWSAPVSGHPTATARSERARRPEVAGPVVKPKRPYFLACRASWTLPTMRAEGERVASPSSFHLAGQTSVGFFDRYRLALNFRSSSSTLRPTL